jgi:hypothetical protein
MTINCEFFGLMISKEGFMAEVLRDRLLVLYSTLVRSKLEYASVVWNSVTLTNSSKLESIQRKFAALCYTRFLMTYEDILGTLHFYRFI